MAQTPWIPDQKAVWLVLIPPTLVGDVLNILSRLVRMAQKLGGAVSALDGLLNLDKQTGSVVNVTSPHSIYKLKKQNKTIGIYFRNEVCPCI